MSRKVLLCLQHDNLMITVALTVQVTWLLITSWQGLLPDEFIYKPPNSFEEEGIAPDIVQLRWRHYEKKRREKLHWAIEERQQLVMLGWQQPQLRAASTVPSRAEDSSAGLKEQRALQAIQARRQQDVDQMLGQERKNAQLAADQAAAAEAERLVCAFFYPFLFFSPTRDYSVFTILVALHNPPPIFQESPSVQTF
jgi:hypothetical protein